MRLPITILMAACACASAAQEPPKTPAPAAPQPVIRAGTQEALLDVVVRDRKGKLVRNLQSKNIEVFDEGARVKVTGFRLVTASDSSGIAAANGSAASGGRSLDPLPQVRLVSLVFERLGNDARHQARQASLEFLKDELAQNVYIAVFIIDQNLHVVQQFTNDRDVLRKAIEEATTTQYTQFGAQSEAIRKQLEAAVSAQASAAASAPAGTGAAAAQMAQVTLNILRFHENLARTQQSRSSILALLSLAREQQPVPGRKTLIYFSEGMQVPGAMIETFNSMVGAANRAGVSVYGVDLRGPAAQGQAAQSQTAAKPQLAASSPVKKQENRGEGSLTPDEAKVFETSRNSLHANTQQTLETLSLDTGGFLITNTGDFRALFRKVSEDVQAYYEVAYVPLISEYDGKFRKIAVKADRSDVTVQTRSGYFALPPKESSVFIYEVPLRHALNATPLPQTFPFRSAALRFRQESGKLEFGLVIEVPMKDIALTDDKANHRFRAHLSLLALFKDEHGEIVESFSRDLPVSAEPDKLEVLRRGNFIQTYHVNLAPGPYTLDSVVMDREAGKLSAQRTSIKVQPPAPGLGISSLALIRRVERPAGSDDDPQDPFLFDGGRVVPTLDDALQASAAGDLSYYFVIYPQSSGADRPQLTMEFLKDGAPIGKASPELPAAGKDGRIPYIAGLPMANFSPGQYELRTTVKQGASIAEERTTFLVHP